MVVGAGWIGGPLANLLALRGHDVAATTRSGSPRGEPQSSVVQFLAFDVERDGAAGLIPLIEGADVVIVCWAPAGRDADRRALYLGGAEAVAAAIAEVPPSRLIYTSSTSALPDLDEELDEDCDQWPTSDRGRLQREAEEVILRGGLDAGVPVAVLRLAGLYGPGRELGRIYRRDPETILQGSGCAPTNLVHREDVLQAILAALELPGTWSGVIHICSDDHRPRREIFAALARRDGLPEPVWELPAEPTRGKSVGNRRLHDLLDVTLRYPRHKTGGS